MNEQTTQYLAPLIPGWVAYSLLGAGRPGLTHLGELEERRPAEIRPETAMELVHLGLATLIDVRQPFELECGGCLKRAENIPLLQFKQAFGRELTEEEREILDSDKPDESDIVSFLSAINRHFHGDRIVLIYCRTGRRSLLAVDLLRSINCDRCFSVAGGFQAIQNVCPEVLELPH
jgi:rhodanese-related sulfurtransferase